MAGKALMLALMALACFESGSASYVTKAVLTVGLPVAFAYNQASAKDKEAVIAAIGAHDEQTSVSYSELEIVENRHRHRSLAEEASKRKTKKAQEEQQRLGSAAMSREALHIPLVEQVCCIAETRHMWHELTCMPAKQRSYCDAEPVELSKCNGCGGTSSTGVAQEAEDAEAARTQQLQEEADLQRQKLPAVFNAVAEASRLKAEMAIGKEPIVCIIGSTSYNAPWMTTEQIDRMKSVVKEVATIFQERFAGRAAFVIGAKDGVHHTFMNAARQSLWRLLLNENRLLEEGDTSNFVVNLYAGETPKQKQDVVGQLGDVYLVFGGFTGAMAEAQAGKERGALLLPFAQTGGTAAQLAASEKDNRPRFASEEQWRSLLDPNPEVSVDVAVEAAEKILDAFLKSKEAS